MRIESGFCPPAILDNAASMRTEVFPVPVLPVIINGVPRWSTHARCSSLKERENPSTSVRTRRRGVEGFLLTVRIQP